MKIDGQCQYTRACIGMGLCMLHFQVVHQLKIIFMTSLFSNNYIHDVRTSGIRVNQQEDFINDIHHTHVVVRGNRIERTGSDGVIVANCISPLIDSNVCFDAGALGTLEDTQLIAGIWVLRDTGCVDSAK